MDNFELMRKRLGYQGGIEQENRMIKDKWRTLNKALLYSYQACTVGKIQSFDTPLSAEAADSFPDVRALINPNKVKQDYDDKVLSIDYEHGYQCGDIFEWRKTDTKWIIYLREITEDAYFRGAIRRCRYKISFKGEDGKVYSTWAAIRGPIETQIISIQKNQERVDTPNLSLNILMPLNDKTRKAFNRYSEFILEGRCWRVEAIDDISMENILEVNAEEYYLNELTDNEIKNGLIISKEELVDNSSSLVGNRFIRPNIEEEYSAPEAGGVWSTSNCGKTKLVASEDGKTVKVTWTKMTQGKFELLWEKDGQKISKDIAVESLY